MATDLNPTIIGRVTITEPFEHTQTYAYAAYYQTIQVTPGTYDVVATFSDLNDFTPYYMAVQVEGTVIRAYLGTGVSVQVGEAVSHRIQHYGYQADDLAGFLHGTIEWLPGFEVQEAWTVEGDKVYGAHVVPVDMIAQLENRVLEAVADAEREQRTAEAARYRADRAARRVDIESRRLAAAERNLRHIEAGRAAQSEVEAGS